MSIVYIFTVFWYMEGEGEVNSNFYLVLVMLQPLLKEHMLENYAEVARLFALWGGCKILIQDSILKKTAKFHMFVVFIFRHI
jgi:hypothetical protein